MNSIDKPGPDAGLQRLVHALVMWGATASQIVTHMEQTKLAGASRSQASTVDAFTTLVREIAAPVVAERRIALERVAATIEAIDAEVCEQVLLVPLARPSGPSQRRRGPH